jgi:acyl dehydratase
MRVSANAAAAAPIGARPLTIHPSGSEKGERPVTVPPHPPGGDGSELLDTSLWYFEDYTLGKGGRTYGRTITDTDVWSFAAVSGDYNPVHFDDTYARAATAFDGRVAHGLFGVAMCTGLLARDAPEILGTRFAGHAFCGVEWDFVRPLKVGDTIFVRYEIGLKEDTSDPKVGMVHHHVVLENADHVVLQRGTIKMLMRKRTGDS